MTAVLNNVPPPFGDAIAKPRRPEYKGEQRDPEEGQVTQPWADYLTHQTQITEQFPARIASVALADQLDSIPTTDMTGGTLSEGVYRLNYWLALITTDGGGRVDLTLSWTYRGNPYSQIVPSLDTAVASDNKAGSFIFASDALSPIQYDVAYAGAGGTYDLRIELEEVHA